MYEKHGHTAIKRTTEYLAWENMKRRCLNKAHPRYKDYGGRGIDVCERWINSFSNFYHDMGPKPGKRYSLDRIDNNSGYCKQNCKWSLLSIQQTNRRRKNRFVGVHFHAYSKKYFASITKNKKTYRLGYFADPIDAAKAYNEANLKLNGPNAFQNRLK